jgi:hypothetical protein
VFADVAAPSSPAAAHLAIFGDSTDLRFHDKNAAGTIGTTVVAYTGASNNFLTAISAAGVISKAQPAFTNLSGAATTAQAGVKTGGTTGQVLAKASNSDYDLVWNAAGNGTVTATGGSLTSNAVVLGAGTTDTKVVSGIITDGVSKLTLGVNTTSLGCVKMFGNTSGDSTVRPPAVAGTSTVVTLPNASSTLPIFGQQITFSGPTAARAVTLPDSDFTVARTDAANTFTGHQTVEGVTSTGATGTGKFVFDTSPTLSNPVVGTQSAGNNSTTAASTAYVDGPTNHGGWTEKYVTGSNATTTGQVLVDITGLTSGTLSNSTVYEFEFRSAMLASTSAGFEIGIHGGGTGAAATVSANGLSANTGINVVSIDTASTVLGAGTTLIPVTLVGFITTRGTGTATISIQFLKVTSGTATCNIGSVFRYRQAGQ